MSATRILILLFLVGCAVPISSSVGSAQERFMGLAIGQSEKEALELIQKTGVGIKITRSSSRLIATDSVEIGECDLFFRRSLGFDSANLLNAVGMTHRMEASTRAGRAQGAAYFCILNLLKREFGEPVQVVIDGTKQFHWDFGETLLTFEEKAYNEDDDFLLLYFFRKKDFP